MYLRIVAMAVLLVALSACGTAQYAAVGHVPSSGQTLTPSTPEGSMALRARIWEWSSFSPKIQAGINETVVQESDATYAFTNGAGSRDYGDAMVAEWQQGGATAVRVCVPITVSYPGTSGSLSVCPGDHDDYPGLTYFEQKVSRDLLRSHGNPQFWAKIKAPPGCRLAYFSELSSRTNADGENELLRALDLGWTAFNLNFILDCRPVQTS